MSGAGQEASGKPPVPTKKSELSLRVASAVVLALGALGSAWWGGWVFIAAWTLLSFIAFFEWQAMVEQRPGKPISDSNIAAGFGGLMFTAYAMGTGDHSASVFVGIAVVALLTGVLSRQMRPIWAGAGYLYAALLLVSVLALRGSPQGFIMILFLFAVVWGADVGAYFTGRTLGGPKLAPAISPNKTWSGFFGGLITAIAAGLALLALFGLPLRPGHALLAALLAIASVLGDLFESWMKRRFGVKDSGTLIPGHGGVMDRLDGFVFAAILAALIGLMIAGFSAPIASPLNAF